ncbi:hypothetical protein BJ684DRAFT_9435, partial [Piptocephalis cylindrospora]
YPPGNLRSISISQEDYDCMKPGEFLNDTCIEFYFKYLERSLEVGDPDLGEQVYCFNTFFYKQLTQTNGEGGGGAMGPGSLAEVNYKAVKKWTSKARLFERDYIFIPIHENFHWYLALICNPGKCLIEDEEKEDKDAEWLYLALTLPHLFPLPSPFIVIFDSLDGRHPRVFSHLRAYLNEEAHHKLGRAVDFSRIRGVYAKVPRQSNFCDCGVFLLHYVERFLANPKKFTQILAVSGEEH